MKFLSKIIKSLNDFFETDKGKLISKISSRVLQVLIIGFLIYQLVQLGWREFLTALPSNPIFYIIVLINYFLLPISEIFTYRISWPITAKIGLPIFIKKRVLNKDVFAYSGEIQLFTWAQKHVNFPKKEIFKVIRDNNILSSLATTFIVFLLLIGFLVTGQISILEHLNEEDYLIYAMVGIFSLILIGVAYYHRSFFFSMPKKKAFAVLSIHMTRFMIVNILQVVQWAVVLPEIPLTVWFTYLSFSLISSRIPFIPNSDLLFIGFSIEAASLLSVSSASIAGLFITQSVIGKLLNVLFFMYFSSKRLNKPIEAQKSNEL